ncbi:hypothetical protein IC617_08290 [Neiella sp. HB171785]|uniref:Uncharacterized protein n=1 Tax=Neiella litorisoli TaxID=2771431 RepID=A0A8J6QIN7_9GAMM|nr:hypothetical protein [Neiella litorisoli]MBD1389423.1 hypothetical protein [Neiella litorisoli]
MESLQLILKILAFAAVAVAVNAGLSGSAGTAIVPLVLGVLFWTASYADRKRFFYG